MSLIDPIADAFATFGRAQRYAHLFALSDGELADRGLDRDALKRMFLDEIDAEIRLRDRYRTPAPAMRSAFS